MSELKYGAGILLAIYLGISGFMFEIRALSGDCKLRYINYVFPLSVLYCEVGKVGQ